MNERATPIHRMPGWLTVGLFAVLGAAVVVLTVRQADLQEQIEDRRRDVEALREQHKKDSTAWETALNERLLALDREHAGEIERRFADLTARIVALDAEHESHVTREEIDLLRTSLRKHTNAVDRILAQDDALRRVLEHYRRGVGLIYGEYSFHVRVGDEVKPATMRGRPIRLEYSGTGFMVTSDGHVMTNRHVVQPWTGNPDVQPLIQRGLIPRLDRITITFPGKKLIDVDKTTIRVSPDEVDLGLFRVDVQGVPVLPLATQDAVSVRGRSVTVLGYPTGITAMLARAEREEVEDVLAKARDAFHLIESLAEARMISPVITQGTVNDVRPRRIIYDALTTSGGSGGPVFGPDGKVVGVNFAITRGFDGANFGVPILFARELLR